MSGIDTGFVHGLCKTTVASSAASSACAAAVGCGIVVLSHTSGSTAYIVVLRGLLSHTHVLKIRVDITYDVLFWAFAFGIIHNHTSYLDHVHPHHFKCFWVAHKHLIAVLDGVAKQFKHPLVQLVQLGPLLQLFFNDLYFVICGLVREFNVKGCFVVVVLLC